MYTIKFDGEIFGRTGVNTDETMRIFAPELELSLNNVGYFTFTIYPAHKFYSEIVNPRHIIEVYREGRTEPIFLGRLASYERGLYNELSVTCESEIAFLMDSVITDYQSSVARNAIYWIRQLIMIHNNDGNTQKYGDICTNNIGRKFEVGNVSQIYQVRSLRPTLENFSGSFSIYEIIMKLVIEPLGGVIKFRHENGINYIDFISEDDITAQGLDITFGRNLLDIGLSDSISEVVTAVRPLGAPVKKGDEYVPKSIALNDVSGYITNSDIKQAQDPDAAVGEPLRYTDCMYSSSLVEKYGWILREVSFEDATALKSLTESAQRFLENSEKRTGSEFRALNVSESNMEFLPGDRVTINSQIHGVDDSELLISGVTLHLDEPDKNYITVGATETITGLTGDGYSYNYTQTGGSISGTGRYDPVGSADAAYERAKSYTDSRFENIVIPRITNVQIDALFAEG